MHITILTIGSRGDVQPYVALGVGLKKAGHHVRLATHAIFESFVHSYGLEYFPIAGDPRGTLEGEAGRGWLESGQNPLAFMQRMMNAALPSAWEIVQDYWGACQESDVILFPPLVALPADSIAEKLGIPAYPAYLQHVHPTSAYPSALAMPMPRLGSFYNRLTYPLGSLVFWQFMRPLVNQFRMQTLGLPKYSGNPFGAWLKERRASLYGISPTVLPKPPEWGAEVHVTGYWFLENEVWEPPAELLAFLAAGPPPVFAGFGSMTNRNPQVVTEIVIAALRQAGQRGIMMTGWGGMGSTSLLEGIMMIDAAPFTWLFPRMAAVVHHGGAGTTAAGLRAGVPTVTVPYFGDQPFWAWRVEQLGAGPAPIPRRNFTAERLAAAIQAAVSSEAMLSRAAELGRRIRAEDGVGRAVQILNRLLEFHPSSR